jgi:hypothetical protein
MNNNLSFVVSLLHVSAPTKHHQGGFIQINKNTANSVEGV